VPVLQTTLEPTRAIGSSRRLCADGAETQAATPVLVGDKMKPPAFQFYAKDWLSSPSVRCMSLCSVGAYIMLLASAWDNEPVATLPDDDEKLRRLARCTPEEWAGSRDEVMANFESFEEEGRLVNARLRQQYQELAAYTDTMKGRAKNAAEARWGKRKDASSNAQASPEQCLPMPLHSAVCNLHSAVCNLQSATSTARREDRSPAVSRSRSKTYPGDCIDGCKRERGSGEIVHHYDCPNRDQTEPRVVYDGMTGSEPEPQPETFRVADVRLEENEQ
jgi:uncharacterized protein YdaU (DUF1376 family)